MRNQAHLTSYADPSLKQMQDVSNSILKAAIAVEKINQAFFWAASEMAVPIVSLKTECSLKASFLKIMESKKGISRDALCFVSAMEKSYALGSGNMSASLRNDVQAVLGVIREKHPSPQVMAA